MDQNILRPESQETIDEVKATQVLSNDPQSAHTFGDENLKNENLTTLSSIFGKLKKYLLRLISLALIVHGVYGFYGEIIEVLYVFPHLPQVIEDTQYDQQAINSLYQKTILILATASVETIYGLALMTKSKHALENLHIFIGAMIFGLSIFISSKITQIEDLDIQHRIPKAPTVRHLIESKSFAEAISLFDNL